MSNQEVADRNARKDSQLPEFISANTPVIITEEDNKHKWLANNMQRLMIWISAAWFGIVLIYITQFFGWSNLFLMMPDEFGGFLAGVTLPLAIIWVVMAYIDRGTSFKNEAKFLRAYMNQLVYPEEGGAQTAKAMAKAEKKAVKEEKKAPVPAKKPAGRRSYIIVASLTSDADAQAALKKYRKSGYKDAEVVESKGRYRIALCGYSDQAAAYRKVTELRKDDRFKSAWVFTVSK